MRKAHRGKKAQIDQLSQALLLNGEAAKSDRIKKSWSAHDLLAISPLTDNQESAFDSFEQFEHVVLNGSPGSGKTLLAVYHALRAIVVDKTHDKLTIIRSAVPCRDQGFIKGPMEDKNSVYEEPYIQICAFLLGRPSSYHDLKKAGIVEFRTTGFLRGVTFDNSIVVVDEAQNMNFGEINTIMTRIGENTRIFFSSDAGQTDLKKNESGYQKALRVWESMEEFDIVTFNRDDIVRSGTVKSWIIACEEIG